MKICVYGGSFNPPHIGHLAAARAAMESLAPEKMLVIPDRAAPHKDMAEGSPAPELRLELARLTFADIPGVEVSDMELRREGKSYRRHPARAAGAVPRSGALPARGDGYALLVREVAGF